MDTGYIIGYDWRTSSWAKTVSKLCFNIFCRSEIQEKYEKIVSEQVEKVLRLQNKWAEVGVARGGGAWRGCLHGPFIRDMRYSMLHYRTWDGSISSTAAVVAGRREDKWWRRPWYGRVGRASARSSTTTICCRVPPSYYYCSYQSRPPRAAAAAATQLTHLFRRECPEQPTTWKSIGYTGHDLWLRKKSSK